MNSKISKFKFKWVLFACLFVFCAACDKPNDSKDPNDPNNPGNTTEYGTGTATDPFRVANVADLKRVASGQTGPGGLVWANDKYYLQIAPIDLSNEGNWKPICPNVSFTAPMSEWFRGEYDGNGYTISNLTNLEDNEDVGLFGNVTGTIKNVRLTKVNFTGAGVAGGGCLVRYLHLLGEIDHCSVTDFNISSVSYLGGLVGKIDASATVSNCMVTNGTVYSDGGVNVGGVAGKNEGRIENCYTTVNVISGWSPGGIVGENTGMVQYCYATGDITSEKPGLNTGGYVGGIMGGGNYPSGTIQNCVALNKALKKGFAAGDDIGRITGSTNTIYSGITLLNNYARPDMTLTADTKSVTITDISTTSIHGANVSAADYSGANSGTWWKNTAGFPEESWDFATNQLPHLKGFKGLTQNPTVMP